MGIRFEDVWTTYLREWRKSDERRFMLQDAERKLGEEALIREKMIMDFEHEMRQKDMKLD